MNFTRFAATFCECCISSHYIVKGQIVVLFLGLAFWGSNSTDREANFLLLWVRHTTELLNSTTAEQQLKNATDMTCWFSAGDYTI